MNRNVALALAMVVIFTLVVTVLLNVMPAPHKSTDYLVMGAVGTLLCLFLLFVLLVKVGLKTQGRAPNPASPEPDPAAPAPTRSKKMLNL